MKRIAILSLHGVADQKKSETARTTAGLLLSKPLEAKYSAFSEENICIGLQKIPLYKEVSLDKSLGVWGDHFEQSPIPAVSL